MITSMSWKAAHFGAVKTHKLYTDHIVSVCIQLLVQRDIDAIISYDIFIVIRQQNWWVDLQKTLPLNRNEII
jgi:hypothetical protein